MAGDTMGTDIVGVHNVGVRLIRVDIGPNPENQEFHGSARPWAVVWSLQEVISLAAP